MSNTYIEIIPPLSQEQEWCEIVILNSFSQYVKKQNDVNNLYRYVTPIISWTQLCEFIISRCYHQQVKWKKNVFYLIGDVTVNKSGNWMMSITYMGLLPLINRVSGWTNFWYRDVLSLSSSISMKSSNITKK